MLNAFASPYHLLCLASCEVTPVRKCPLQTAKACGNFLTMQLLIQVSKPQYPKQRGREICNNSAACFLTMLGISYEMDSKKGPRNHSGIRDSVALAKLVGLKLST